MGVVFTIAGLISLSQPKVEGIQVEATIVDIIKEEMGTNADGYTEFSYTVYVDYTDKDGNEHKRVEYPGHEDDMVVGNKITAEYDPNNPGVLISNDSFIVSILFLAVGLVAVGFSIYKIITTIKKKDINEFNRVDMSNVSETQIDNSKPAGYEETTQKGVAGENKVTKKIQKVNGEIVNTVTVSTEVIKEPIKEIITKSDKVAGYGSVVATRGQWGWPATCSSVSSGFGWRWGALHDGTDIAGCGYGSNIFAAQAGTVVQSSSKFDNGQYITIDHHNGYYTMYAHLSARYAKVGDYVEKGQVIGAMGQTGFATGVHLHFAIWRGYPYRGGVAQNAMNYY